VCCVFGVFFVACCVRGRECYVVCEWFSVSRLVCDVTARVSRDVQCIVLSVACVLCLFLSVLRTVLVLCHLCVIRVVWDIVRCVRYALYICCELCIVRSVRPCVLHVLCVFCVMCAVFEMCFINSVFVVLRFAYFLHVFSHVLWVVRVLRVVVICVCLCLTGRVWGSLFEC